MDGLLTLWEPFQLLTPPAIELPQIHQTADAFGHCDKLVKCESVILSWIELLAGRDSRFAPERSNEVASLR